MEKIHYYNITPYGEIKFVEYKNHPDMPEYLGYRLFINEGLQWDSRDEYRYHQLLFATPFLMLRKKKKNKVLILGGGDGFGARELLKLGNVEIDLVDISECMTNFAKNNHIMQKLNQNSLSDKRVNVINDDGVTFVKNAIQEDKKWDLIILDYPDPTPFEKDPVNNLFSVEHYKDVAKILNKNGVVSLQATSVLLMPNTFRKIQLNLSKAFQSILPLRVNIPSYGDIGMVYCKNEEDPQWKFYKEIPEHFFFEEFTFDSFLKFFKDERTLYTDEVLEDIEISKIMNFDLLRKDFF